MMVFSSSKSKKKRGNNNNNNNTCISDDSTCRTEEIASTMDQQPQQPQQSIYYFGIGPIVNSQVRKRQTYDCVSRTKSAVLPNHRITFCYGGIANVVPQRGYEVHGVLMKWESSEQWDRWEKTHPGYTPEVLEVFPYDSTSNNDDNDKQNKKIPIAVYARVFVLKEFDPKKLDEKIIENLPSERYLKLIAIGMRECNADEDFIFDSILSVPFVPSRKPEDYQTFPISAKILSSNKNQALPKISSSKYKRMCKNKSKTDIYFCLGSNIFQVDKPFDLENNPGIQWVQQHCHGQIDSTLLLHKTCVEPGLPVVDTPEELTDDHSKWAENEAVEFLKKCGVTATKVYQLVDDDQQQSWSLFGRG